MNKQNKHKDIGEQSCGYQRGREVGERDKWVKRVNSMVTDGN